MSPQAPSFADLLGCARVSAVQLEMRDSYGVDDEAGDFARWQTTGERDTDPTSPHWAHWARLMQNPMARGVSVRRARIVSEPVSDYIRFEHAGTSVNLRACEEVRWLPRRLAGDIALSGNDFWLMDGRVVRWNHFAGNGAPLAGRSATPRQQ